MSYDPESTAPLDKARGELGDTDTDNELLTDEHISLWLTTEGYNGGIAYLANELAVRYAQMPGSVTLPSGLSVSWPRRVETWLGIATRFQALAAAEGQTTTAPVSAAARIQVVW